MFNSYEYNPTQKVNINAVSGTISRTCEKSFFVYGEIGSPVMKNLMDEKPIRDGKPVVVLQSMCIGNNYMMFEVMREKDFEELKEQK